MDGNIVAEVSAQSLSDDNHDYSIDYWMSTGVTFSLPEELTDFDAYVLNIPAGFFIVGERNNGGDSSEAMTFVYTTVPTEVLGVTPSEGETVSSLYEFSIALSKTFNVVYGGEAISLYNLSTTDLVASIPVDENEQYYYTFNSDRNVISFVLDQVVTTPGEYMLVIPAGKFLMNGYEPNDDMEFTFTIAGATGIEVAEAETDKVTVVTLSGVVVLKDADRSELKSLKKGLYIVNGKKVVVK